jgi:hypothetical protein
MGITCTYVRGAGQPRAVCYDAGLGASLSGAPTRPRKTGRDLPRRTGIRRVMTNRNKQLSAWLPRLRLDNPKQDCEQETQSKQTHNVMHDPRPPRPCVASINVKYQC